MQISSLNYFLKLAEAGSFYAAAKQLIISQQGLNKAITALESELGVKLIERSRNGVLLTQQGEILRAHAQTIWDEYRHMVDDLIENEWSSATSESDRLVVNSTYYPIQVAAGIEGGALLSDRATVNELPYIELFQQANSSDGHSIFIVGLHPYSHTLLDEHTNIVFEPFLKTQFGVVCREDSPIAKFEHLHRSTLTHVPLAYNSQDDMARLTFWLFRNHPLQEVVLHATSPRMLLEFAQGSPERCATFDSFGFHASRFDPYMPTEGLVFIPLSTPESICDIGALLNKRNHPTVRVRHAIDSLGRYLNKQFPQYFDQYPLTHAS